MAQDKRQQQQQGKGEGQSMQRSSERESRTGMQRQGMSMQRTPFAFMRRMMDDMDRLFGEFGMGGMLPRGMSMLEEPMLGRGGGMQMFSPEIEVMEKNGKLLVRADLPGMTPEDIRVNVEDNALILEGERKSEEEKTEGGVYHSERTYGSFRRVIPLPRGMNAETCDAHFDNGVLEIQLDLPREERRKSIDIKSGAKEPEKQEKQAQPRGGGQPQENGPGAPSTRH